MNKIAFNKYVVVAYINGSAYMLQMRGVINWFFDNNHLKVFKTITTALKAAHKVRAQYRVDCVKVYRIYDNDDYITCCEFPKWDKEQPERVVGYIDANTGRTLTGNSARIAVAGMAA